MKTNTNAIIELTEDDGWFRNDSAGREVIQWRHSHHYPVKVGDQVLCEGRTVTVAAIGSVFTPHRSKGKFAYLYTSIPVRRNSQESSIIDDGALDAFVASSNRESCETGEFHSA